MGIWLLIGIRHQNEKYIDEGESPQTPLYSFELLGSWVGIGPSNGSSPVRHHAITQTNADLL